MLTKFIFIIFTKSDITLNYSDKYHKKKNNNLEISKNSVKHIKFEIDIKNEIFTMDNWKKKCKQK